VSSYVSHTGYCVAVTQPDQFTVRSAALTAAVQTWAGRVPATGTVGKAIAATATVYVAFLDGIAPVPSESHIDHRFDTLESMMTAAQSDIDALTTAVGSAVTALEADVTSIQAEITALKAANPGVNITALQTAVSGLTSTVSSVGALAPAPTPTPAPGA
jgi:hypothetical protein